MNIQNRYTELTRKTKGKSKKLRFAHFCQSKGAEISEKKIFSLSLIAPYKLANSNRRRYKFITSTNLREAENSTQFGHGYGSRTRTKIPPLESAQSVISIWKNKTKKKKQRNGPPLPNPTSTRLILQPSPIKTPNFHDLNPTNHIERKKKKEKKPPFCIDDYEIERESKKHSFTWEEEEEAFDRRRPRAITILHSSNLPPNSRRNRARSEGEAEYYRRRGERERERLRRGQVYRKVGEENAGETGEMGTCAECRLFFSFSSWSVPKPKKEKKDNYKMSNFMILEEIKSGTLLVWIMKIMRYQILSKFCYSYALSGP